MSSYQLCSAENEVISEAHVSAAQAIHVRARVKPEDDSAEQLNGVKMVSFNKCKTFCP